MITLERYGIRNGDDNPVIETSTYIEADPDHPLAVEIEGHEGFWVRVAVGNSLTAVNARPVSKVQYNAAVSELHDRIEVMQAEHEARREAAKMELADKKAQVSKELAKLGLSAQTIDAILAQVQG